MTDASVKGGSPFRPEVLSKIGRLELRARYVADGFLAGMHRSPYKGFSVEFANHRAYVPGDDLRHLDWRVYAKADRLYVKEYEVDTNLRTYLLLDGSQSMAYPEHPVDGRMTKWEYASTAAASLAHLLLRQQDAVGLVLFDGQGHETLPPSTRRVALKPLAEAIEARGEQMRASQTGATGGLSTSAGPHGLAARNSAHSSASALVGKPPVAPGAITADAGATGAVLQRLADDLPKRSMVVILSDLLSDPDAIIGGLRTLRHHQKDILVLHILDSDELTFPFDQRTRFLGLERWDFGVSIDPQSLRRAYLDAVEQFVARIRTACLNIQIDYALLSTAEPLDVALSTFLARRMHWLRSKV